MILADTNIVSTFARVGALGFVRQVVRADRLYVTPSNLNEIRETVDKGCTFLASTLEVIHAGSELDVLVLRREEILAVKDLPKSLGAGEAAGDRCLHEAARNSAAVQRQASQEFLPRAFAARAWTSLTSFAPFGYEQSSRRRRSEHSSITSRWRKAWSSRTRISSSSETGGTPYPGPVAGPR